MTGSSLIQMGSPSDTSINLDPQPRYSSTDAGSRELSSFSRPNQNRFSVLFFVKIKMVHLISWDGYKQAPVPRILDGQLLACFACTHEVRATKFCTSVSHYSHERFERLWVGHALTSYAIRIARRRIKDILRSGHDVGFTKNWIRTRPYPHRAVSI